MHSLIYWSLFICLLLASSEALVKLFTTPGLDPSIVNFAQAPNTVNLSDPLTSDETYHRKYVRTFDIPAEETWQIEILSAVYALNSAESPLFWIVPDSAGLPAPLNQALLSSESHTITEIGSLLSLNGSGYGLFNFSVSPPLVLSEGRYWLQTLRQSSSLTALGLFNTTGGNGLAAGWCGSKFEGLTCGFGTTILVLAPNDTWVLQTPNSKLPMIEIYGDHLGACCDGENCTLTTSDDCINGTYQGDTTSCLPNNACLIPSSSSTGASLDDGTDTTPTGDGTGDGTDINTGDGTHDGTDNGTGDGDGDGDKSESIRISPSFLTWGYI